MENHSSPRASSSRPLILASASPRRSELLHRAGVPFEIRPAQTEELSGRNGEDARTVCRANAWLKAREIAAEAPAGSLVLGADTIVVCDGQILGKPDNPEAACRILRLLSGRVHRVSTAFVLLEAPEGAHHEEMVSTDVEFATLSENDIRDYVATGEPMDKAGAYGIQGIGARWVRSISGSYTSVVGLPVVEVLEALARLHGPRPRLGAPVGEETR